MATNDNSSAMAGFAGAVATALAAVGTWVGSLFKRITDLEKEQAIHAVEIGAMQEDLKQLEAKLEAGFDRVIQAIKSK